jgi:hypothetical protein
MALVRQLCAFCTVRVACVPAILVSAVRTWWAVRSCRGVAPMLVSTGFSESRLTSTVFAVRPGKPLASQSATAFSSV